MFVLSSTGRPAKDTGTCCSPFAEWKPLNFPSNQDLKKSLCNCVFFFLLISRSSVGGGSALEFPPLSVVGVCVWRGKLTRDGSGVRGGEMATEHAHLYAVGDKLR